MDLVQFISLDKVCHDKGTIAIQELPTDMVELFCQREAQERPGPGSAVFSFGKKYILICLIVTRN